MPDAVNRTYPSADAVADWYVSKSETVSSTSDLVVGQHIGASAPGGVGKPADFEGLTPILRVDNPADGWNDGTPYVVYFIKTVDGSRQFWKATNADPSTLAELTSGDEYDFITPYQPPIV
jgi:hypothetical protein